MLDISLTATAGRSATPAAPGAAAQRRQRIEGRTIRVSDAARPLVGLQTEWSTGTPDEGDALAVGRPGRAAVVIDAGRQERHPPRANVVDADQRVVDAVADEGELRSVRRPDRSAIATPGLDERLGVANNLSCPSCPSCPSGRSRPSCPRCPSCPNRVGVNLPVFRKQHPATVRGESRCRSFAEFPAGSTRCPCRPDCPLSPRRIRGGVRDPAVAIRLCAADEYGDGAVVRHTDVAQLDPVVFRNVGHTHRRERRRGRGVHVAQPVLVRGPGDPLGLLCRDHFGRRAGPQELLDRRRRRFGRRHTARPHPNQSAEENNDHALHNDPPVMALRPARNRLTRPGT